jgi:glucose-6-phosphate dehydrogenase assembly protein OpcA
MIITLDGTSSAKISAELLRARRSAGSPAQGMVLTLIVVCDASEFADAMEASMAAGREHPSRILLVVRSGEHEAGLDAEVHIGEGTPGEVVVIRMHGAVADHPASVIRPLLLPDSPVVIWWPGTAPQDQTADELAQLTLRRLTDAAAAAEPRAALEARAAAYSPGDTDLSWTRLTPWRALLAAALDQYPATVTDARVEAEDNNPSAELLVAWLGDPPLFPQHQEVELSWEILDPILDYWASRPEQPEPYEPGSWGPAGADAMLARDGFTWRRP